MFHVVLQKENGAVGLNKSIWPFHVLIKTLSYIGWSRSLSDLYTIVHEMSAYLIPSTPDPTTRWVLTGAQVWHKTHTRNSHTHTDKFQRNRQSLERVSHRPEWKVTRSITAHRILLEPTTGFFPPLAKIQNAQTPHSATCQSCMTDSTFNIIWIWQTVLSHCLSWRSGINLISTVFTGTITTVREST